jgi:uncharacterized protein YhfF
MRTLQVGQPGPDRRRLTDLVLAGRKTATARPWEATRADERLEAVGERLLLVDSFGRSAAVLEVDAAWLTTLGDVDESFVTADDPNYPTVGAWRTAVEQKWTATVGPLTDHTPVVCVRFHVVGRDHHDG